MMSHRLLATLCGALLLAACGERTEIHNITAPTAGSAVRFFNFGPSTPSVNFYANDKKLSAGSSTSCSDPVTGATTDSTCLSTGKESTTGTAYGNPANGVNGQYSSIAPGSYTLSGHITTTTDNGVAVSSTQATLESGKFYSYYLSGIYNSATKQTDAFVVQDPLPDFDYTKAYVRFVNAISNSQPMTLYAKSTTTTTETAIGGTIAYKSAGAFVAIPADIYDLNTRLAGSSTNVITRTAVSFLAGRVYTVTARGDITVTSTTAANRPILDNTLNR